MLLRTRVPRGAFVANPVVEHREAGDLLPRLNDRAELIVTRASRERFEPLAMGDRSRNGSMSGWPGNRWGGNPAVHTVVCDMRIVSTTGTLGYPNDRFTWVKGRIRLSETAIVIGL